jgi:hypothetical protein
MNFGTVEGFTGLRNVVATAASTILLGGSFAVGPSFRASIINVLIQQVATKPDTAPFSQLSFASIRQSPSSHLMMQREDASKQPRVDLSARPGFSQVVGGECPAFSHRFRGSPGGVPGGLTFQLGVQFRSHENGVCG